MPFGTIGAERVKSHVVFLYFGLRLHQACFSKKLGQPGLKASLSYLLLCMALRTIRKSAFLGSACVLKRGVGRLRLGERTEGHLRL